MKFCWKIDILNFPLSKRFDTPAPAMVLMKKLCSTPSPKQIPQYTLDLQFRNYEWTVPKRAYCNGSIYCVLVGVLWGWSKSRFHQEIMRHTSTWFTSRSTFGVVCFIMWNDGSVMVDELLSPASIPFAGFYLDPRQHVTNFFVFTYMGISH